MQTLKESIRCKILEGARNEFSARGYGGTSMKSMAARCGISVGTIYKYFESKDCLFWIQKTFMPALNRRVGMQVVPVGGTNAHHEPDQFFGVYRPEGENTIMPCTWHEVGVTLWGRAGAWRYQAMFLPGLDSERFGNQSWIHDGSASPFEFKIANNYAFAARVDNTSVPGLRLSVSGYVGNSFRNTLYNTSNASNDGVRGTVTIGSFDFAYRNSHVLARGYFDYGHLSDAAHISKFNISMSKNSTSKRQTIASDAIAMGAEAGYDIFSIMNSRLVRGQKTICVRPLRLLRLDV